MKNNYITLIIKIGNEKSLFLRLLDTSSLYVIQLGNLTIIAIIIEVKVMSLII